MLVESVLANITNSRDCPAPGTIDWLNLTWIECRKRFASKRTQSGREVRILLRLGQSLKEGDVLGQWPDGQTVIVNLIPAHLFMIRFDRPSDAISAAFQIGNLHLPIELESDILYVPCGNDVEAMLAKFSIPSEQVLRKFQPTHWPEMVQINTDSLMVRYGPGNG